MWRRALWALVIALTLAVATWGGGVQARVGVNHYTRDGVSFAPSTSIDIVISWDPLFGTDLTGFTATFISPTRIRLEWAKGTSVNNTMVRAAYEREPEGITDGYLVYQGTATTFEDTATNLDVNFGKIYYIAFADNSTDWQPEYVRAEVVNPNVNELVEQMNVFNNLLPAGLALIGLILFAVLAFWKPQAVLFMILAGVSIMAGLYAPDMVSPAGQTNGLGITIGLGLIGFAFFAIYLAFRYLFFKPKGAEGG